jgi:hypothetical protein
MSKTDHPSYQAVIRPDISFEEALSYLASCKAFVSKDLTFSDAEYYFENNEGIEVACGYKAPGKVSVSIYDFTLPADLSYEQRLQLLKAPTIVAMSRNDNRGVW